MNWRLASFVLAFAALTLLMGSMEASAASADGTSGQSVVSSGIDSVMSLAQYSSSESSSSTRVSGRGVGKLIAFAIAAVIGLGRFVFKMFRGE